MTRSHTVFSDNFPASWASGWGEDEYGLWMSFNYKGVRHLRWCDAENSDGEYSDCPQVFQCFRKFLNQPHQQYRMGVGLAAALFPALHGARIGADRVGKDRP